MNNSDDSHAQAVQSQDQKRFAPFAALVQLVKCNRFVFHSSQPLKISLLLFSFGILTYVLYFRAAHVEMLELGGIAPRYVTAQTDFDFLDEEASQALKQEAVQGIGTIEKIDEQQIDAVKRDLRRSFLENVRWRQELPLTTIETFYALLDASENYLNGVRFTDVQTCQKLQHRESFFPGPLFYMEAQTPFSDHVCLSLETYLKEVRQSDPQTVKLLVNALRHKSWKMVQDFPLERRVRQEIKEAVSDQYTHVHAGTQLIKKGERITSAHIAMAKAMKEALDHLQHRWTLPSLIGSAIVALCLMTALFLYLHHFHRSRLKSFQQMLLIITLLGMGLFFAKGAERFLLQEGKTLSEAARFPLVLPFFSLLACVLVGSEIAIASSFFLLAVCVITLAVDVVPFTLLNCFACLVTIFFARRLHKRKEVFSVLGKVYLSVIPLVFAFNLLEHTAGEINFTIDVVATFLFLAASALITVGVLPIFETLFHVMTDMALMEYMDPDHELLRRLSLEAPRTYQHCLVAGNIAEVAARSIGANGLFCRVSTLYHDIGKLFNPHYFTENQLGGFNIHQLLTPMESTQVIIAHVSEGETLARKYHLPQSFIDVIREHHGTTMVYYFYCKQVEQMGGDATAVNEKCFRYLGPKPRSKESAIIMIADTVEAASRSIEELTEDGIAEIVDKLVTEKAEDGQFDDCQLTFEELGKVKKAVVKALMITHHLRIKYPARPGTQSAYLPKPL